MVAELVVVLVVDVGEVAWVTRYLATPRGKEGVALLLLGDG